VAAEPPRVVLNKSSIERHNAVYWFKSKMGPRMRKGDENGMCYQLVLVPMTISLSPMRLVVRTKQVAAEVAF
jgi:hypothetical protein